MLDDNGKLDYSKYKYDLNSLFANTPIFPEPSIPFKMKNHEYNSLWGKVADLVLNSRRGKVNKYMEGCRSVYGDPDLIPNLPFKFVKVDDERIKEEIK